MKKNPANGVDDTPVVTSTVFDATSDRDGYVEIPIVVGPDVDVFQVVVRPARNYASTDYVYAPDGTLMLDWEDWYGSDYSLTEAFYPGEFATTLNWPVREGDGPLEEGTWTVVCSTQNNAYEYEGDRNVEVEVLTRNDEDFDAGTLHVIVAYAEGVEAEEGVAEAVEAAVEYWGELYAAYGIALTTEFTQIAVDAALPDTYEGLDEIRALHEAQDERAVVVVVGEDIGGDAFIYGEAGGIPGPYAAANHAAVEISWLANSGPDGRFSDPDVLLMGETFGHEVGHYLGLFHPIEDGFEYFDAIDDTAECASYTACEARLGANLMYPYPVCESMSTSTCVRQDTLSDGQLGVAQRYMGVE